MANNNIKGKVRLMFQDEAGFGRKQWEDIAEDNCYTLRHVQRIHSGALAKIDCNDSTKYQGVLC